MGKNAKLIRRFDILIVVILISTFLIILNYSIMECLNIAKDSTGCEWKIIAGAAIVITIAIAILIVKLLCLIKEAKNINAKVSGREDRLKRKAKEIEYEISSLIVFVERKINYYKDKKDKEDKNTQGIDFSNDQISQPLINDILEIKEKTVKLHKILEESGSYTKQQEENLNNFISKCVNLLIDFQRKKFEIPETDYTLLTDAFNIFLEKQTNNGSGNGNGSENRNGNGKS